jgi:hypothetical protein
VRRPTASAADVVQIKFHVLTARLDTSFRFQAPPEEKVLLRKPKRGFRLLRPPAREGYDLPAHEVAAVTCKKEGEFSLLRIGS